MKVMDVSVENKDTSIETVTPPRKKMKQAQLPFQMVGTLGPSTASANKKRKMESGSPIERRSPRTGKGVKKQNSAKRIKGSEVPIIELNPTDDTENSSKIVTVEVEIDSKESDKDGEAKIDEEVPKDSKTEVKKRKDYSVLNMFLKKAQSKENKDDIQLLAMSDYESGNSKDSDASLRNKVDVQESLSKELNSKEEIENDVSKSDTECQIDAKTEENTEPKNCDDEIEAASLESKGIDIDSTCKIKDSVTSDDNDMKNVDSDSDMGVLSSDEDADDDLNKSSNENGDKDTNLDSGDMSKTPQGQKSSAFKNKKLTPKQIERRIQNAKKQEEKLRLKKEKEKKREKEREIRRKEKEEKRREKEEKEKVEKEQKRKEKEMKDLKKLIETEQKQKEKEVKEEERRKREEEKLEAERKKQKAASNFANFFVPKKQESKATEEDNVVKDQNFMPFEVKVDMRVAPITRKNLTNENKLTFEGLFNKGVSPNKLYLNELKQHPNAVGRSDKTWPYEAKDDIIIIDEDDGSSDAVDPGSVTVTEKHHPKLFMFAENRRPPFWGTWRKKSDHINRRRPFAKDSKWFDYDVDSDDEWEEEEPGESIRGSDDERDEEGPEENEYDVDNDFMVPHGYLSDEEGKADEEDGEDMSPETQKLKLKLLGEQFEAERKTKTSKIKPKVIGCVWQGSINTYPENTAPNIVNILIARQAWVREIPITFNAASSVLESLPQSTTECGSPASQTMGPKKKRVPDEAIPNLIRLIHGNINGRIFLIKEFMAYWEKNKTGDRQISKLSLSRKIKEIASWIACPEEGPMHLRSCWYVREDVRKEYNCEELTLPNRWEYTLRPTRRSDVVDVEKPEKIDRVKKRIPLITQFTTKITQKEMQKQLVVKPTTSVSKPPKRVALISVPRGEQFQQSLRDNFISKFGSSVESKIVENQKNQSVVDQQLPVVEKFHEIHDVDDSDAQITEVTTKDAINDASSSLNDEEVDENSLTAGNSEIKAGTEIAESLKSMDDSTKVPRIDNKSEVTEAMETEEDEVRILQD